VNRVAEFMDAMKPVPSLEEMGKLIGCSSEQVRKIRSGFDNPGIRMARKFAGVLGKTLDEVFPEDFKSRKRRAA
jgi:transcriptional regulator with XRE-family HTH domain